MTDNDAKMLRALAGKSGSREMSVGVDDLQGLLLQVSLAIMMIFMIAFFMFRMKSEKEQQEQVMELTRQKLSLACDRVEGEYRTRYAAHALGQTGPMTAEEWEAYKKEDYAMNALVGKDGAEKASYIANKTLRKVYKKVGFVAKT